MISPAYITEWSQQCPWTSPAQVEQDLVLSRGLVEIFSDPILSGCHRFTALALLRLSPALDSSNTENQLEALVELLDGCEVLIPQNRNTPGIETHHPARIHAIIRLDRQSWERVYHEAPQLIERGLLIADVAPPVGTAPHAGTAPKTEGATVFNQCYGAALHTIGITRRDGHCIEVGFLGPDAAERFQSQLNDHVAAREDLACGARNLPVVLAWTQIILAQHMGCYESPADDEIIDTSFAAARRLLDRHQLRAETMATASRRTSMLALAGQLVRKVRDKQPIGERALVRCFDCQQVDRYRPVIEILVEAQVLQRTPARTLQLGPTRFEEVHAGLALPAPMS